MSESDEDKIDEIYRLVKKNNSMIKRMHDAQKRAFIFRLIKWFVVIALAVAVYVYIEPYVDQFEGLYENFKETSEKTQDFLENVPFQNE